jgi:hypothetical protein
LAEVVSPESSGYFPLRDGKRRANGWQAEYRFPEWLASVFRPRQGAPLQSIKPSSPQSDPSFRRFGNSFSQQSGPSFRLSVG